MRHSLTIFSVLLCLAGSLALADENPFDGGKGGQTSVDTVHVTGDICQKVVRHQPQEDVSYKPGVDVYGNPVEPADLPGSTVEFSLPETVEFDLPLNPFEFMGRPDLADLFPNAAFSIGHIKYDVGAGEVTLNGRLLNDDQKTALAAACRFVSEQRRKEQH